jgi:hypothetical protein
MRRRLQNEILHQPGYGLGQHVHEQVCPVVRYEEKQREKSQLTSELFFIGFVFRELKAPRNAGSEIKAALRGGQPSAVETQSHRINTYRVLYSACSRQQRA